MRVKPETWNAPGSAECMDIKLGMQLGKGAAGGHTRLHVDQVVPATGTQEDMFHCVHRFSYRFVLA